MASKSRANTSAGSRKGKAGRRPPTRAKSGGDVLLLPIIVGAVVALAVIAMIVLIVYLQRPQASQTPAAGGIPCDQLEHTQVHYHAALQIIYHGVVTNLPDNTGIQLDSAGNVSCYYWLHVHSNSKNVIHIESPASQTFTVAQFFAVWNQWSVSHGYGAQKLDATHVAQFTLQPGEQIVTYVDLSDGKGATVHEGDPGTIILRSHEVITIEITPPAVNPPPSFTFPSGL